MSKELEALELVRFHESFGNNGMFEEEYQLIEKALKALEIIKKKRVDTRTLIAFFGFDNEFERYLGLKNYNKQQHYEENYLTQEEYDLLKEVLL